MAAAIGYRKTSTQRLLGLLPSTKEGPQARRLLAFLAIYEGATRNEAAKIAGVTLQIIHDSVSRFDALGPDSLVDRKDLWHRTKQALLSEGRTIVELGRVEDSNPDRDALLRGRAGETGH
ncbi:hypothetical protein WOC76_01675 [Methylocystis sp. IM3]|uniref:hypothetical protein n=1 Tax=unclassified Methylocystis TaxID=2625913 RepID=UPI0030F6F798